MSRRYSLVVLNLFFEISLKDIILVFFSIRVVFVVGIEFSVILLIFEWCVCEVVKKMIWFFLFRVGLNTGVMIVKSGRWDLFAIGELVSSIFSDLRLDF